MKSAILLRGPVISLYINLFCGEIKNIKDW